MQSDWLRENMMTILSIVGVASALCVGGIFVLYFMVKRKTRQKKQGQ